MMKSKTTLSVAPEQLHTENREHTQYQLRVELWMREGSLSIHDSQQDILAQLQHLVENGFLSDFTVNTWGKRIGTDTSGHPDGPASRELAKLREFETWADQNGHSLQPGFQRHTQSSLITDTTREVIATPFFCLAVYEDDTLREVAPCSEPNGYHTFSECLQSLADTTE
jgi:hypothetical protein